MAEVVGRDAIDLLGIEPCTLRGRPQEGSPSRVLAEDQTALGAGPAERHPGALDTLVSRFQALSGARSPEEHEHLGPIEEFIDLIRENVFEYDEAPLDDEPPY